MAHDVTHSDTIANFANNPAPILEKLRRSSEPMLLVQDGAGDIVVQDATSYQHMLDKMDQLESLAAIKESLQDMAAGRTWPMREALAQLATKHHLPSAQES